MAAETEGRWADFKRVLYSVFGTKKYPLGESCGDLEVFTWSKELLLWCESVATTYFKVEEKQAVEKGVGKAQAVWSPGAAPAGSVPCVRGWSGCCLRGCPPARFH